MLFKKQIEPSCSYCSFGNLISGDEVMCIKKGIVSPAGQCRRFKYDPLKRKPSVPVKPKSAEFTAEDFSID